MTVSGRTDEEGIEIDVSRMFPGLASITAEDSTGMVIVRLDANHLRVLAKLASAAADELDARSIGP